MPKSVDFIVDDLNARLKKAGATHGTILWENFLRDYEIQRWKYPRDVQIQDKARDKYGLIVGYGHQVVAVSIDRNQEPI